MAQDLDDAQFWLPSHFLTDDDILMDFGFSAPTTTTTHGGSSSSFSDSNFTESDDDDLPTHLHSSSSCPVHSKGREVLSSSPQSTLWGCNCNQSSSRESASPSAQTQGEEKKKTFDLLIKAAGEVARLKLRIENKKVTGTGFFDCTQPRPSYPPPPPPLFFQPHFPLFPPPPPPMIWAPSTALQPQQQQNRRIKNENKSNPNKNNNNNNNNRPLGLPASAWPPLQAQKTGESKPKMPSLFVGPPKGTGVFLPRSLPTPTPVPQPRKKDANTSTKSKSGKGCQSQTNQRGNTSGKTTSNQNEIQLPQEWTY